MQLASAMGMRAIVIDTGAAKRKLALEMGAEAFVDFREVEDVAGEVKRIAGGVGAHGVVVTAVQAYKDAILYLGDRIGGTVICVGLREFASFAPCLSVFLSSSFLINSLITYLHLKSTKTNTPSAAKGTTTISADPSLVAFRGIKIMGSLVGTMQDTAKSLEYAQRGLLKSICEVRGLSQMPESVQQLRRGEVAGRVVIDFNIP